MTNYEDYLKQVADLGGKDTPKNSFLEIFLHTEYGDGYTYEGDLLNNLPHGQGVLYYPNKQVYAIGEFEKGRLHGFSKTYYDDKTPKAIGNFKNGEIEGEAQLFKNNLLWIDGFIKKGLLNGKGKCFQYLDSAHFLQEEGNYKDGKLDGFGKVFHKKNQLIFEGNFQNDTFIKGKYWIKKDSYFEGSFTDIERNPENDSFAVSNFYTCKGNLVRLINGKIITLEKGKFTFGLLDEGRRFDIDGVLKEEGKFHVDVISIPVRNDLLNGCRFHKNGKVFEKGLFIYSETGDTSKQGKSTFLYRGERFQESGFKISDGEHILNELGENILHGEGTLYFGNARNYHSGVFKNGVLKNGIKSFNDGLYTLSGSFESDLLHGKGEIKDYKPSTNVYGLKDKTITISKSGEFKNGKLCGYGEIIDYNLEYKDVGFYQNDVIISGNRYNLYGLKAIGEYSDGKYVPYGDTNSIFAKFKRLFKKENVVSFPKNSTE